MQRKKILQVTGMAIILLVLVSGCASQKRDQMKEDSGYAGVMNATEIENSRLEALRAREKQVERRKPLPVAPAIPIVPQFNPLDEVTVSLNMREQPLHDVLFVVARNAGLNLVIEPGISLENTVTISFVEAKSSTVLESLLRAYDLSWSVQDNLLYVQRFAEKTFDLGFLNVATEVEIENGGDIFGSSSSEATSSVDDLQGKFKITSSLGKGLEEDSIYYFLVNSLTNIVGNRSTTSDKATTATSDEVKENGYFILDPTAGSLYVKTTPSKMKAINKLVGDLKQKFAKQVIIDARILEVTLNDNSYLGVNWNIVSQRINDTAIGLNWNMDTAGSIVSSIIPSGSSSGGGTFNRSSSKDTINAAVEALQTFGGVKAVANPHIRARHSQPALITSGRTETYVSEVTTTFNDEGSITSESPVTAKAFSGIMLGVYPYIDQRGEVDLQIFPIKSSVDLSTTTVIGGNTIILPKVDVQNVLTSLHVRDGDTIILGGLIQKTYNNTDNGIPGAMDIPVAGWLFKQKAKTDSVTELVIIMNISIVE